MKQDIILSGVGGQGILSIATIIGEAATKAGLNLKQAEVHGMSQRGGDVQSNLRLSTETIYSDLIEKGKADIIIAMEPMEALRYAHYLSADGVIVTSSTCFDLPSTVEPQKILDELSSYPKVAKVDTEYLAAQIGNVKGSNMVLLGMAAPYLTILSPDQLRSAIATIFASKGESVVESNVKAFNEGYEFVTKK